MSVNKVFLLGYVGQDPEIRYPEKDYPVAYFSLATNERAPGGQQEITEWHYIVLTGSNAAIAEKYIRKGTRIFIEGRLRSREYEDKLKIRRRRTEIYGDRIELLGRNA